MDAPRPSQPSGTRLAPRHLAVAAWLAMAGACPLAPAQAQDSPPQSPPQQSPPPIGDQSGGDPADDAELNDESVEQVRETLKERGHSRILLPTASVSTAPASPASSADAAIDAGLPSIDPDGPSPQLLAEGSFIVRRRGVLMGTDWGAYLFAFAPGPEGTREKPVAILPCETLRRMESAAGASGDAQASSATRVRVVGTFLLTGQVTAYKGRNYVLPTAFSLTEELSNQPASGASPDVPPDTEPAKPRPDEDPEISDLISDLESLRSAPRGGPVARAAVPGAESPTLLADDTLVPRRRARMVRTGRGEAAFAFDAGEPGAADAPVILLPCAATEGIERAAARAGDSTIFDISGRVFQHQGRNYLLPLMYIAETSRNVKPLH